MTNSRYWQALSEEAWAQSVNMRDKGAQAVMEGIAKAYEKLVASAVEFEKERPKVPQSATPTL